MMQQTLDGETTDEEFERPDTQIYCRDCDAWILRSQRFDHDDHLLVDRDDIDDLDDSGLELTTSNQSDDEPRIVGGIYDVYLDYKDTYYQQVAAASKDQAQRLAKESIKPSDSPVDSMQLHEDIRKKEDLDENDPRMENVPGWPW